MELRKYLYESLLDDEEDLINTDDINIIINNLKNKGFNRLKKVGNSVHIEDTVTNAAKSKTKDLDEAVFNGYLGDNFSYIDRFQIYGDPEANKSIYPKFSLNIKEVDALVISTHGDTDILKKFDGRINIGSCGYANIECRDVSEKTAEIINNIIPDKSEQIFLTSGSINILKALKGKNIDLIRISASDLDMEVGNKNILPKSAAAIINDLYKNNNINSINIAFAKMRTASIGSGVKISKRAFKLIPYKNSYKIG